MFLLFQVRQYLDESSERCNVREWACGGWLQGRELPPERSKWNRRVEVEQQGNLSFLFTFTFTQCFIFNFLYKIYSYF